MKIQIELTSAEEERIVIYCKEITDEIKRIKQGLENRDKTLLGFLEEKSVVLKPEEILYFEAVDKKVFAYTKDCCIA
jgi:DNA-binding LytR/AlgR family response regulator